ncbi:unnamed protein product [Phytomonas sp. EM1]|nr:unnamed protein product [Phytomonas sp. EM1]|eukprot:CCW61569.1 unnamed protein product [Phytomonas sp. isolate EM1]
MSKSDIELAAQVDEALDAFFFEMNFGKHIFTTDEAVKALVLFTGHPEEEVVATIGPDASTFKRADFFHPAYVILRHEREEEGADNEEEGDDSAGRSTTLVEEFPAALHSSSSGRPPLPSTDGRKLCKQFQLNGSCGFGSRCLYHHVRPPNEDVKQTVEELMEYSFVNDL